MSVGLLDGRRVRCTLMLLKKSPHAVAAPQTKISTSQIVLQAAARESWLGVKRPMKTSQNNSAPTFSTASFGSGHWDSDVSIGGFGSTTEIRRRTEIGQEARFDGAAYIVKK
jgi:hypothetical protein